MELMPIPYVNPLKMGRQPATHPLSAENVILRQDAHADDLNMVEDCGQECLSANKPRVVRRLCYRDLSRFMTLGFARATLYTLENFYMSACVTHPSLDGQATWCLLLP